MDSVLVVSSSETELFESSLRATVTAQIFTVSNSGEARRLLPRQDFDLVVINTPLPDEFGTDLALHTAAVSTSGIILAVRSAAADEICHRVEDCGVLVLPKPVGRGLFYQTVRLAMATRRRLCGLQRENIRLQGKIEEIRLVDRAKCALIEYLKMTEAQAHRYIEKQAMDLRTTRRQISENILKTYENT